MDKSTTTLSHSYGVHSSLSIIGGLNTTSCTVRFVFFCLVLTSLTVYGPQGRTMDQDSLLRKILAGELHYAKLWVVCVALRGVAWDKMPFEQRELAFQAKDAASNCLAIFLNSSEYRFVKLFCYEFVSLIDYTSRTVFAS